MGNNDPVVTIDEVLDYWFGSIGTGFNTVNQNKLWYGGGKQTDEEISLKFGVMVELALQEQLDQWRVSPQGELALVLLLDQFTRNIFRGSQRAFAGDNIAVNIVIEAIRRGDDKQLTAVQRSFFYMPLEHSEILEHQNLCVQMFQSLLAEVPVEGKATIQSSLDFAIKHRDIVKQFGRFPHRNNALGRASTAEEHDYLASGGARFGQ